VSAAATGGSGQTGETHETHETGEPGRKGRTGGPQPGPEGGIVYLVGAGPGDPGLLTLRGAEVLKRADVVVHDRLTAASLLSLAPPASQKVDVGKQPDDRGDQGAINALLIERAKAGLEVVRLKGGDPFVFGRGGEEALALIEAGVAFEVVPGVTSAVAAPAYAGVPVTHRGLVTAFTVVAGHTRSVDHEPSDGGTNWEALAAGGGTIVVLMGAAHRRKIAERLMAGGLSPGTPVAAVQWGTGPGQVTLRTTLGRLGAEPLAPPVTIVVGEVAGLNLSWYEDRPLFGQTIVVTRATHQAPELTTRLEHLGARVVEVPVIGLAPPSDGGAALRASVSRLSAGRYSWVIFTSANAVHRFFELVPDTRSLGGVQVAAVGPATAEALRAYRIVADLVPHDYQSEGLLEVFPLPPPALPAQTGGPAPARGAGRSVLLPQAAGARPELRVGLERRGWDVDAVEVYRTVPQPVSRGVLELAGQAGFICFASSSAVDSYVDQAQAAGAEPPPIVVCIGPVTAATARARGLTVSVEASEHTLDGLVSALVEAGAKPAGRPGPPEEAAAEPSSMTWSVARGGRRTEPSGG
jgi:uroporphyrinogen III methyltransferase/synthase